MSSKYPTGDIGDKTGIKLGLIREALDTLSIALVDHKHQWSDKERGLYDKAACLIEGWEV